MPHLRPAGPGDVDALYDICLRTGAAGDDASELLDDHTLLGDLFVVPYAVLEPEHAFVLDDGAGAAVGYVVGALDSRAFEARCEADWYPAARRRHAPPDPSQGLDGIFLGVLHNPPTARDDVVGDFPSHLHIDLLPAVQGQGWGRRMMTTMCDALRADGSPGVHLGVGDANGRARAFYDRLGWREAAFDGFTRTLVLPL